jgi:hypothetical protein
VRTSVALSGAEDNQFSRPTSRSASDSAFGEPAVLPPSGASARRVAEYLDGVECATGVVHTKSEVARFCVREGHRAFDVIKILDEVRERRRADSDNDVAPSVEPVSVSAVNTFEDRAHAVDVTTLASRPARRHIVEDLWAEKSILAIAAEEGDGKTIWAEQRSAEGPGRTSIRLLRFGGSAPDAGVVRRY